MGKNKSERELAGEILIVDDAAINLKLLVRILAESHYQVRSAKNGREALKAVAEKTPDLILLDVLMPEMDGFEVCRRLKAQAYSRDIPVIFISTLDDVVDKTKGFQLGAVDYITKVFEPGEVLARVQTHLTIRSHQTKLEAVNRQLRNAENELRRMNAELEERVRRRSAALEKANLEIRRSEERFREFVEGTDNLITQIDAQGHLLYANNAAFKVFGMPPEECIGLPLLSFVEARDRKHTEDWFSACVQDRVGCKNSSQHKLLNQREMHFVSS
jgi:DNA-binding response OmpR family regulator